MRTVESRGIPLGHSQAFCSVPSLKDKDLRGIVGQFLQRGADRFQRWGKRGFKGLSGFLLRELRFLSRGFFCHIP